MVEKLKGFDVVDFRFAETTDSHDIKYNAWSRAYEYEYVLDFIKSHKTNECKIHNSSWGFEGIHVMFRDELDKIGICVHSDIVNSNYRSTYYYNILESDKNLLNEFNFVINISTIEHIDKSSDRILAISNLFNQVISGGYLILTFDYPRVNLPEIEEYLGVKCSKNNNILNGKNSVIVDKRYADLNIVYLILKKNE